MQYDFTSILDRHGRDAIAVDGLGRNPGFSPDAPGEGFDAIPMWVADMNFPTVPTVTEALVERAKHPAYGYFAATDEYYDSIIRWHVTRNGCDPALLTRACIGYENGVLGGVVSALTCCTAPGDPVLVHSPTYIGFTKSLTNNGYKIVHSPLVKDANGVWRMDYQDMDQKLKKYHIHTAVFCSPHNPCGRVWERWELEKAMEVYKANDCVVISDEIWSDILLNGHKHIPTQSVSEDARNRTIALYAPSKTFNLAGLVGSYHIIYNSYLRDRCVAKSSKCHYNDMNLHARPDRRLQAGGLCLGGRAVPGSLRQHQLRLRLHPGPLPGGHRQQAGGHLHALCGLHRLVRRSRQNHRRCGKGRLGRGRCHSGRPDVPRTLFGADESGPALHTGPGSL